MAGGAQQEIGTFPGVGRTREQRHARRIADLYAGDPQFRGAAPNAEVAADARQPGLRLPQIACW